MAGEIILLDNDAEAVAAGPRRSAFSVLMLLPITSPKSAGGTPPVPIPFPGPVSELPPLAQIATDATQRQAIDTGTLGWRVLSIVQDTGQSDLDFDARLQAAYATQLAALNTEYDEKYRRVGVRLDAS